MKKLFTLIVLAVMTLPMFATETTIWSGSHDCGSWNGNQDLGWGGYDWSTVVAGTTLKVYFTEDATKEYWQLTLGVAGDGWKALNENTDGVNLTSGQEDFSIVLTQADVTRLTEKNGLIFTGAHITVTKVTLNDEDAPKPETEDINLSEQMNCIWDAGYDPDTKVVTWTGAWGGAGWWYGDDSAEGTPSKDCTDFESVTFEFSAASAAGGIEVSYVAAGDNGWASFDAGATTVTCKLDSDRKNHVKQIIIKLASAESLTLTRVYFTKSSATGITATTVSPSLSRKFIEGGKVVIVKGAQKFNLNGQILK